MAKESFKKIENENFYTSPPYSYRPSIAEYLTTGSLTENSLIADIMHLDHKKAIKISIIKNKIFHIKLIDSSELDFSEIVIWEYLEKIEKNNEIILDINEIPRGVKNDFYNEVRRKCYLKFHWSLFPKGKDSDEIFPEFNEKERFELKKYRLNSQNSPKYELIITRIMTGIVFTAFNFLGILTLFSIIAGLIKLSNHKRDLKFFGRHFLLRYLKISFLYLFVIIIFLFGQRIIINNLKFNYNSFMILGVLISGIIYIAFYLYFFYKYATILVDYLMWLFESKSARDNRIDWLDFKKFVIDNSEIEKAPLGHYKIWGPFYYYLLAVGGIEKKYIS